jgi:hypothetical protein
MRKTILKSLVVPVTSLVVLTGVFSCGRSSSSEEEGGGGGGGGGGFSGNMQNIVGTLTSQTGTPTQMRSWVVALVEAASRVARTAATDVSGVLRWGKVSLDSTHTAVLLSPDYLLQSIMAMPSTKTNTVKQYFTIQNTLLPQLVQRGPVVSFQTTSGITMQDLYAADSDADGNPNGTGAFGLTDEQLRLVTVDTDSDGIPNDIDGDVDGDGLVNSFDNDDDGDGIDDIFDADANGNLVTDSQESNGDSYYGQGIEYFAVRYEESPTTNSFLFVVKLRQGLTAESVKIKTASSLTDGSQAVEGGGGVSAWDLTLLDDGANFDGSAGDLLFARKVQLASGKTPRVNQVLFAQVTFGSGESAFTLEFPWTFPNVDMGAISTSYNTSSRVMTLSGDPFGSTQQSFVWSVTVTNSDGLKIYESAATPGTTRTLTLPANILQSGASYTYEVVAQTRDKIPGMPAGAVRSATGTINN